MKSLNELLTTADVISFVTPLKGVRYFIALLIILLILVILFVLFTPWTPAIRGVGQIIAFDPNSRRQMIEAPINGRIDKWFVTEGMEVQKGSLLAKMVDIDPSRLDRLQEMLRASRQELEALEQQERRAKIHVRRMRTLHEKGIESKRHLELSEIDLYKVQSSIQGTRMKQQEIESEISRQSSQEVRAPMNGTIMKLMATENSTVVKVGDYVAQIVPANVQLAAELIIRGKDLPLIHVGQKARLAFEGWPAVQIVGWPSLAIGTFGGEIAIIDPGDDGDGNFRIVVLEQAGEEWPDEILRMGSKAEGWIQMPPVPVWWELWRSFSGVPPLTNTDAYKKYKYGSKE